MRYIRTLTAALTAALLLSGCQQAASGTASSGTTRHYGRIAFTPCALSNDFSRNSIEAQCAQFRVAENPDAPKGRQISLNIAWLPATDEGAATADPVFFLAGGPGQAATEVWPSLDAAFNEIRRRRNVILVDQRGTGKSHPLICRDQKGASAVMEADTETGDTAAVVAFAKDCASKLDADPRFYTTTDAVRDLDSVRAALGVAKINLIGGSYGTRVAQQYALRHPEHTRSLVLDGLVPNELILGSEHAKNLDAALALQFAKCSQLPACKQRFGADTRAQLRELMARLQAQPVAVDYRDPVSGELRHDTVTAGTVAGLTRMFAYAPQAASLLPLVLNEADQGRYAPLMALAQLIHGQVSEGIMHGMQLSVTCAEDVDLLKDDPGDADTVLGGSLTGLLRAQCQVWPTGSRPKDFHAPLRSSVPALLVSGEFDPVTPPRYGEVVLKGLSNGRHLVLHGQGHGNFSAGCMPKLIGKFIETANAKQLDAKCLDSLSYVPPFTSFNGWEP